MNRSRFGLSLAMGLMLMATAYAQSPLKNYWQNRFNGQGLPVGPVEGLAERVQDGKLHLNLRDFLSLVLKNEPGIGSITAFELLDSQSRLANSESALVGAYVNYQKAYISYERATQTLLNGYGMVVKTP